MRLFFQYILVLIKKKKKKPILSLFHRFLGAKHLIAGSFRFATLFAIASAILLLTTMHVSI
ncbi:hypothetical protein Hanom_Chr12g01128631 [Helianthus anomalus]